MPRIIFMAGTLLASSFGLALAGLVLREAIRNARARKPLQAFSSSAFSFPDSLATRRKTAVRGYDSPEIAQDDIVARARYLGNDRSIQ